MESKQLELIYLEMNPLRLSGLWNSMYTQYGGFNANFNCPGPCEYQSNGKANVKIFSNQEEYERYHHQNSSYINNLTDEIPGDW